MVQGTIQLLSKSKHLSLPSPVLNSFFTKIFTRFAFSCNSTLFNYYCPISILFQYSFPFSLLYCPFTAIAVTLFTCSFVCFLWSGSPLPPWIYSNPFLLNALLLILNTIQEFKYVCWVSKWKGILCNCQTE